MAALLPYRKAHLLKCYNWKLYSEEKANEIRHYISRVNRKGKH